MGCTIICKTHVRRPNSLIRQFNVVVEHEVRHHRLHFVSDEETTRASKSGVRLQQKGPRDDVPSMSSVTKYEIAEMRRHL